MDDFSFHHTLTTASLEPRGLSPSTHRQFEILYLVDGDIKYFIDGEEYRVESGDVIFVPPNEIHSLEVSKNSNYERIVVMFD